MQVFKRIRFIAERCGQVYWDNQTSKMNRILATLLLLLIVKVGHGQKNSEEFRNKQLTDEYIVKTDH